MDKDYAIQVVESVECGTLEKDSSLAREAYRYLLKLKNISVSVKNKIDKLKGV